MLVNCNNLLKTSITRLESQAVNSWSIFNEKCILLNYCANDTHPILKRRVQSQGSVHIMLYISALLTAWVYRLRSNNVYSMHGDQFLDTKVHIAYMFTAKPGSERHWRLSLACRITEDTSMKHRADLFYRTAINSGIKPPITASYKHNSNPIERASEQCIAYSRSSPSVRPSDLTCSPLLTTTQAVNCDIQTRQIYTCYS